MAGQTKGKTERVKGNVKEATGKLTGNQRLVTKGKAQQTKGNAREAAKKAKDTLTQ
jgi:uncharacterized protein YjbJ (UPF0337 family)